MIQLILAIIVIAALIIIGAIARVRQQTRITKHNAVIMDNQPDEPINPEAVYPTSYITANMVETHDRVFKLGRLFGSLRYHEIYNITFEEYLHKVNNGTWHELARA